jgi:hypothetical protein
MRRTQGQEMNPAPTVMRSLCDAGRAYDKVASASPCRPVGAIGIGSPTGTGSGAGLGPHVALLHEALLEEHQALTGVGGKL